MGSFYTVVQIKSNQTPLLLEMDLSKISRYYLLFKQLEIDFSKELWLKSPLDKDW